VRFHGILDDDMSTFLSGSANMANVLNAYGNIVDAGAVPVIELSFFPL